MVGCRFLPPQMVVWIPAVTIVPPIPHIILFTSILKYGVLKILKMLVYNIYIYISLGFKVIISSIYEVLVHAPSSSMLRSMIFLTFNKNIVTVLYILVYIISENISYYPVVVILDLA